MGSVWAISLELYSHGAPGVPVMLDWSAEAIGVSDQGFDRRLLVSDDHLIEF